MRQSTAFQENFWRRAIRLGLNLQVAINELEFHTTQFPSTFYPREAHLGQMMIEGRASKETVAVLRRRGHDVEVVGVWRLGRVTAAAKEGPLLEVAANPRFMQGHAFGR